MRRYIPHILFLTVFALLVILIVGASKRHGLSLGGAETGQKPDQGERSVLTERQRSPGHRVGPRKRFIDGFKTPIEFWGKVEDQEGNPVGGARITFRPVDVPWDLDGRSSVFTRYSDSQGLFAISGIRGSSLGVLVEKDGFVPKMDKSGESLSRRRFHYSFSDAMPRFQPPSKDQPAVFVLRKKLEASMLYTNTRRRYPLTTDGAPIRIKLRPGEPEFILNCWADLEGRYGQGRNAPFDWSFKARILNGRLQKASDPNGVEAPDFGYKEEIFVKFSGLSEDWTWAKSGLGFWAYLSDGSYARINIDIRVGRQNLVSVNSRHNPTGSPVLECDPESEISFR